MGCLFELLFGWIADWYLGIVLKPPWLPSKRLPRLRLAVVIRLAITAILMLLIVRLVAGCSEEYDRTREPGLIFVGLLLMIPAAVVVLGSLLIARVLAHQRAWGAWLGLAADGLFIMGLLSRIISGSPILLIPAVLLALEAGCLAEALMSGDLD